MIDGPFANNTTTMIVRHNESGPDEVGGYVFASAGSDGVTQEQRWVLYDGFIPLPVDVILEQPQRRFQYSSLADWQEAIHQGESGPLWQPRATYVKVWSKSYTSIENPVQSPLPFPPITAAIEADTAGIADRRVRERGKGKKKPKPSGVPQGPVQIEERPRCLLQSSTCHGEVLGTKILSLVGEVPHNHEYWVMYPGYSLPGVASVPTVIGYGSTAYSYLEAFFDGVRDEMTRNPGSTFTIASCVYLAGLPADP
jgi:hypothetical protein